MVAGCASGEPEDERAAALELAEDLFEADWPVPKGHGVRLNYRSLQRGGDDAVAHVSLSEIRHTLAGSGGALIVSYHIFENRWQALASFLDAKAGIDEVIAAHKAAGEDSPVTFSTDRHDLGTICYFYRPDRECMSRSDNVVIRVLSRLEAFGAGGSHELRWLALAREHLRNVRSGTVTTASPLPTIPPPDQFDR